MAFGRRRFLELGAPAALGVSACSPVEILNGLAPDRLYRQGIAYGDGPRHRLDLYRPAGIGPFPVLVFLYGGGWDTGDRAMYRFLGGVFAASGFLTVIPDYRLYPEVRYPDFLLDCADAVAWTRANVARHDGDAAAPILMGHSAGAYNAAMLALDEALLGRVGLSPRHDLGRVIGLAGPYDFLPLHTETLHRIFGADPTPPATQPIMHVDGRNPPMLLLAGTADTTVRPENTLRLAARIRERSGPVQARLYAGIDHTEIIGAIAAPLRWLAPTLHDCLGFMRAA